MRFVYLFIVLLTSCKNLNLGSLSSSTNTSIGSVSASFCLENPISSQDTLKLIFVIDRDQTNQQYLVSGTPVAGNDPNGYYRFGSTLTFLSTIPSEPSIYYARVDFTTTANIVSPFTNNQASFASQLASSEASLPSGDSGSTEYSPALGLVYSMINTDIQNNLTNLSERTRYVIFFLTCSYPSIPPDTMTQIQSDLQEIYGLSQTYPQVVSLVETNFVLYYNGSSPPSATLSLLQTMDGWGNGGTPPNSVLLANTNSINYDAFSVPILNVQHVLSGVYIRNRSATWSINSQTGMAEEMLDQDGDGLPDNLEVQLGSNPTLSDSDGNYISDYVEYTAFGTPCGGSQCQPNLARVLWQTNNCSTSWTGSGFIDADNDGFTEDYLVNDCAEKILGSNPQNISTNGSGIPDPLSILSQIAYLAGEYSPFTDSDMDGIPDGMEVKNNTPPFFNNALIPNLSTYQYALTFTGYDTSSGAPSGIPCYQLEVGNVSYFSGYQNIIDAYIVETDGATSGNFILRKGRKYMSSGNVSFSDSDFN